MIKSYTMVTSGATVPTVSDRAASNNSLDAIDSIKQGIQDVSDSIGGNVEALHYYELPPVIAERSLAVEDSIKSHNNSLQNLQWADAFFNEMENRTRAFTAMVEDAREMAATAMNLQGGIATFDIRLESTAKLTLLQAALNTSSYGRYLFSGSRTTIQPVIDIVNNTNVVDGNVTANYYQGDDFDSAIYIDANTFPYGVRANDDGFQKLIAGLHILKNSQKADGSFDKDIVARGESLINEAFPLVSSMIERVGRAHGIVYDTIQQKEEEITYLSQMYFNLNGMDESERAQKMLEIMQLGNTLRMLFATTKKITEMSFVNYM